MSEFVLCDDLEVATELELELETNIAPGPPSYKCTGACKTARCPCKRWAMAAIHPDVNADQQCSIQMEEEAVHMDDIGGEMNSSDSDGEPENFCRRTVNSECGDTLYYCLAVKQLPCALGKCVIRYHEINSHKINSHAINSREINSHEINFSQDQFPYDLNSFFFQLQIKYA